MTWVPSPWHRPRPDTAIESRSWTDPCPRCGAGVTRVDGTAIVVVSNPEAVIPVRNPACLYDEDDPDSPDCICAPVVNPRPDPLLDQAHVVGAEYTLSPCGHVVPTIQVYTQTRPAAGTLGALMADWAAGGEEP